MDKNSRTHVLEFTFIKGNPAKGKYDVTKIRRLSKTVTEALIQVQTKEKEKRNYLKVMAIVEMFSYANIGVLSRSHATTVMVYVHFGTEKAEV